MEPSQKRLLPSPDLSCAEVGQLPTTFSMVCLYLENVLAGFVVRREDTSSLANTVVDI